MVARQVVLLLSAGSMFACSQKQQAFTVPIVSSSDQDPLSIGNGKNGVSATSPNKGGVQPGSLPVDEKVVPPQDIGGAFLTMGCTNNDEKKKNGIADLSCVFMTEKQELYRGNVDIKSVFAQNADSADSVLAFSVNKNGSKATQVNIEIPLSKIETMSKMSIVRANSAASASNNGLAKYDYPIGVWDKKFGFVNDQFNQNIDWDSCEKNATQNTIQINESGMGICPNNQVVVMISRADNSINKPGIGCCSFNEKGGYILSNSYMVREDVCETNEGLIGFENIFAQRVKCAPLSFKNDINGASLPAVLADLKPRPASFQLGIFKWIDCNIFDNNCSQTPPAATPTPVIPTLVPTEMATAVPTPVPMPTTAPILVQEAISFQEIPPQNVLPKNMMKAVNNSGNSEVVYCAPPSFAAGISTTLEMTSSGTNYIITPLCITLKKP